MSDSKSSSNKSGSGNTNNHSNNNNNNNTNNNNNRDDIYRFDSDHISLMRKDKPWERDNKFFKHCKVSALAAIKMLKHALSGVEKGKKQGRPPVEVMGLMIGKMEGDSIIVMDCCPLPVEGTETKVVAEDAAPYMTELLDSLEKRRNEGFTGWYHSHPFDVESYSHCHLSSTDVQTQSAWQFSLPSWTAIVVDPLRSLAKQEPEFGAFRVYPAKYNPPANEQPDGSIMTDELSRAVRWGNSHNRYYSMKISYFMSSLGTNLLDTMSKNNLWVRVLSSSTIMETDNRQRFAERVRKAAEKIDNADNVSQSSGTLSKFSGGGGSSNKKKGANEELTRVSQTCAEIGVEQCKGHCSQIAKDLLFNIIAAHIEKEKAQEAALGSH